MKKYLTSPSPLPVQDYRDHYHHKTRDCSHDMISINLRQLVVLMMVHGDFLHPERVMMQVWGMNSQTSIMYMTMIGQQKVSWDHISHL